MAASLEAAHEAIRQLLQYAVGMTVAILKLVDVIARVNGIQPASLPPCSTASRFGN